MKISALTYATTAAPPKAVPRVPPSLGIRAIPSRVIGFYGFRAAREGIAAAMLAATRAGEPFHRIEMEVDVGNSPNAVRAGLGNIAQMGFVNFALCKVDLINDVLEILGGRESSVEDALSQRPASINRLWAHPRYKNVKVFVSDLSAGRNRRTRVAFIRSPDLIGQIIVTS